MPVESQESLQRREIPHPAEPGRRVPAFATWQQACRHIEDHLLTAPERDAWPLVAPALADQIPQGSDRQCRLMAQLARDTQGATIQPTYDAYCQAMTDASLDARRLAWHAGRPKVTVAIGTTGLLVVVQDEVKTAFLPGQGVAEATRKSRETAFDADEDRPVLRRQSAMLSGRDGQFAAAQGRGRDSTRRILDTLRRRADRLQKMTSDEQLYYRVFRPAVQWIRRQHTRVRAPDGDVYPGRDYALLKDVLPPMSRLKLEEWRQIRHGQDAPHGAPSPSVAPRSQV